MAEHNVSLKRKRNAEDHKQNCLCHILPNVKTKLVTEFTEKSWTKFKKCSELRKDSIWLSMKDQWQSGPRGGYHRQCYQEYTNFSKISRITTDKPHKPCEIAANSNLEDNTEVPNKRLRSQLDPFDINKCVICQKEKINRTRGMARTREPLTQNISEYGSATLLKAATIREDKSVLLQIEGQDTIALEIKYHRSCYKEYVRQENLAKIEEKSCQMEDSTDTYRHAFQEVGDYVQSEVITNAKVVGMTDLVKLFENALVERGVKTTGYRSSKLKFRLQKFFGERISFHRPENPNQAELVYSSKVSKGAIIETAVQYSKKAYDVSEEINDTEADTATSADVIEDARQVYYASKLLRNALLGVEQRIQWPLGVDDLDCENEIVPDIVYNMLVWLLHPKAQYSSKRVLNVPQHIHRIVLSLAQDMIHCVSKGRIKTPKHVALPVAVKSLTGSSEAVTILNRFGHGLSYSQIEELETAIAEKEIERESDGVLLPSVCIPNVPAVFCWDNNDLLEETLSGKGTTHCTNGIIVQRKPPHTCELPKQPSEKRGKKPKRSISGVSSDILAYHSGPRVGPQPFKVDFNDMTEIRDESLVAGAKLVDFGWMLCRMSFEDTLFDCQGQEQVIPAWTGFNVNLHKKDAPYQCTISYCPVIEASPTELPTVYTLLQRSLRMADQLNQHDVIIVFDQAIYAKALEVMWQNKETFKRLVLRIGSFHTVCAFLAAIGKRFGDAGLADILVESGIVGSGSVSGVLEGKHYNRALRTHKIVYEALHRIQWQSFKSWLQAHNKPFNFATVVNSIKEIRSEFTIEKFERLKSNEEFLELSNLYDEFWQHDNGPMKKFWGSYLQMVATALHFIRATREGNWLLHLDCVKELLSWFFAYDHTNYSRYLPVYLATMLALKDTHPQALKQLQAGDFGVQRAQDQGFTQVPVDQSIEQTLNRSTKSRGGIIGFSLNKGAVQRWMLTAHSRAKIVEKCREMTTTENTSSENRQTHKEKGQSRLKKDEADVQKVISTVLDWCNPFDSSEDLTNISSGYVADASITKDLLDAKETGKRAFKSFVEKRILSNNVGFFDTLSKLKLGTFRDVQKKSTIKQGGKEVIIKADRNLFARLIVIGQSRQIDLRDLLAHELGTLPWSLASLDGTLAKTNKATLQKSLEDNVECLPSLPTNTTTVIIDAMATLQMIVKIPDTFSDLSEMVLSSILAQAGTGVTRVDLVADQYPEVSIKGTERDRRGHSGQILISISSRQQTCPRQWKRFMSNGLNKTRLMHFLVQDWTTNGHLFAGKIGSRVLYVTHGSNCTKIKGEDGKVVGSPELQLSSQQEEADTRMFLHAKHASTHGHTHVAIKSSDTDVEVLACYYHTKIAANLTIISGNRTRLRIVSVEKICEKMGPGVCQSLPALHALTGCDSVSAFVGKGKANALKMVMKKEGIRSLISDLGESVPPNDEVIKDVEEFVCKLYDVNAGKDVNETRYKMFCKSKNLQSYQLPPTRASLVNHIKRANYQCYIWKHALEENVVIPSPDGQGWRLNGQALEIVWCNLAPAPEDVMQLICCRCQGACKTMRCSCLKSGLPCSEACQCSEECENTTQVDVELDDIEDEEDENSQDDE